MNKFVRSNGQRGTYPRYRLEVLNRDLKSKVLIKDSQKGFFEE